MEDSDSDDSDHIDANMNIVDNDDSINAVDNDDSINAVDDDDSITFQ